MIEKYLWLGSHRKHSRVKKNTFILASCDFYTFDFCYVFLHSNYYISTENCIKTVWYLRQKPFNIGGGGRGGQTFGSELHNTKKWRIFLWQCEMQYNITFYNCVLLKWNPLPPSPKEEFEKHWNPSNVLKKTMHNPFPGLTVCYLTCTAMCVQVSAFNVQPVRLVVNVVSPFALMNKRSFHTSNWKPPVSKIMLCCK